MTWVSMLLIYATVSFLLTIPFLIRWWRAP